MAVPSIGKLRGLQQMADERGIFVMCAVDHRGSLKRMLGRGDPGSVSYQDMVDFKNDLADAVRETASAILLDPVYGAAQAVAAGSVPGNVGLIVSTEASGYDGGAGARRTNLLPNWSAAKIKRMGASAAKLLLYYNPDLEDAAAHQRTLLEGLARDCVEADLALVVEPVAYPPGTNATNADRAAFAAEKPRLVIESARQLTRFPIDILKAEFPTDPAFEKDEANMLAQCRELDAATPVPWVLLSAGVGFDDFLPQVRIASRAGASGFLAGRALWQEAVELSSREDRAQFFRTVVVERLRRLAAAAHEHERPWWSKHAAGAGDEGSLSPAPAEDWYAAF